MTFTVSDVELRGTVKISYPEFQKIPYDGLGHHLVKGVHIITPAPSTRHQEISATIHVELMKYVQKNKLGKVLASPLDVKLSKHDGYQPDIIFLTSAQEKLISPNYIDGSPTIIIEISAKASAKADYGWKKDLAEQYGVREYWVIDLTQELVEVFQLKDNKYESFAIYKKENRIKSSLIILKGFNLDVGANFP